MECVNRFIAFSLALLSSVYISAQVDSLLQRKWYYCANQGISENEVHIKTFSSKENQCDEGYLFYWEFRVDHSFARDLRGEEHETPTPYGGTSGIINGIWLNVHDHWSFENEILTIGDFNFAIDVLDENNLLIHCLMDD
jgi:hypothetical protein